MIFREIRLVAVSLNSAGTDSPTVRRRGKPCFFQLCEVGPDPDNLSTRKIYRVYNLPAASTIYSWVRNQHLIGLAILKGPLYAEDFK